MKHIKNNFKNMLDDKIKFTEQTVRNNLKKLYNLKLYITWTLYS